MRVVLLPAAVLLSTCQLALAAAFGPETTTTMNTQFVTVYSSSLKVATLGVIVSKRYFVTTHGFNYQPEAYITYFGDTTNGVNLGLRTRVIEGRLMPFSVLKFCHSNISGYNALPFADADQLDFTRNHSATIFYWRPSTNKFMSRSADVLDDCLCPEDPVGHGGSRGCFDIGSGLSCEHMLDSVVTTNDTTIYPWVIIDGKAAGFIDKPMCSAFYSSYKYEFYKLKYFKDHLLEIADFEKK